MNSKVFSNFYCQILKEFFRTGKNRHRAIPAMFLHKLALIYICLITVTEARTGNENIDMCDRQCTKDIPPKICHYHFKVEAYQSFSRACHYCPFVQEDCFRPYCIHAAGVVRPVTVVNRMLPGPKIQVCAKDLVVVDVQNEMINSESFTIHWHGQHLLHNPFMDGVPMVTQCPIQKATTFRYKFEATTPGTHFWHSHSGNHRGDGAAGLLIVRQPRSEDPHGNLYDYDLPEHQMVIQDWLLESTTDRFLRHHFSDGDNKPRTLIFNGKGAYRGWTDARSNETLYTPREVFTVSKNKRYRFRVANNGLLNAPFVMSIDNHTMLMIASDGATFEPVEMDSFVIYAGERWDFILNATSEIGNYWIRLTGMLDGKVYNSSQLAILRYDGAAVENPKEDGDYDSMFRSGKQLNPLNSVSNGDKLDVIGLKNTKKQEDWVEKDPDHKFYLAYDFYGKNSNQFHDSQYYRIEDSRFKLFYPLINNISSLMPSSPILYQHDGIDPETICYDPGVPRACSRGRDAFCECIHVLKVELNSVVEVLTIDEGFKYNANHPFHLHGHSFKVVGMDIIGSTVTRDEVIQMDEEGRIRRNLENPIEKDTVTVPDGGFTIIKFLAKNPGFWLFHCHLQFHGEIGMAVIFQVGETAQHPKPPENFPRCGNYIPPIVETSHTNYSCPKNKSNKIIWNPVLALWTSIFSIIILHIVKGSVPI